MTRPALILVASLLGLTAAQASPYSVHIERQRGETLVVEHTPVPGTIRGSLIRGKAVVARRRALRQRSARVRRGRIAVVRAEAVYTGSAIAGGCREGGLVRRSAPPSTLVLQLEVCESIAPISSLPPPYDPRFPGRTGPSF